MLRCHQNAWKAFAYFTVLCVGTRSNDNTTHAITQMLPQYSSHLLTATLFLRFLDQLVLHCILCIFTLFLIARLQYAQLLVFSVQSFSQVVRVVRQHSQLATLQTNEQMPLMLAQMQGTNW